MKKKEDQKNNKNSNSQNKKNKKNIPEKNESSKEFNFFSYFYQNENEEYKLKSKEDKSTEEYINPKLLIEQLKKEEKDTKILLMQLKEKKLGTKTIINELKELKKNEIENKDKENKENKNKEEKQPDQEDIIKERYDTKKKIKENKILLAKEMKKNVIKDEKNIKRTNKMDKKINTQVFQYFNDKENNLDFNKKLNLIEDDYKENIDRVDHDLFRNLSEYKYIKAQNENKLKIEQRKKLEEERKEHLLKMEKDNLKYQRLVKNNFKIEKKNSKNNLIKFKEEKTIKGNKSSPIQEQKEKLSNKFRRRTKAEVRLTLKLGICQLPRVNDNLNFAAHEELNNILQKNINRTKKLEKLLLFKKKYRYFDISSYIQTGKMSEIKKAKIVRIKHEDISLANFKPSFNLNFEIGKNNLNNDIIVYRNYLQSCKYNNNEHIQAYLLLAKNDVEVWTMVNERDEYGRNGLMYLLIHNNINMIKLTLLSGVTLDSKSDIFGRNLIHYCCTNNVGPEMMDIICHCVDFKNFSDLCKYVDKCIPIDNNSIEEFGSYSQKNLMILFK